MTSPSIRHDHLSTRRRRIQSSITMDNSSHASRTPGTVRGNLRHCRRIRHSLPQLRRGLVESIFLIPCLWTLFTCNYPRWARGNFARLAIPILPLALAALYRWVPKDRRITWGMAVVTLILAAASAIDINHVAAVNVTFSDR